MGIGTVTQVLEYVRRLGERRLADPGRALSAHLCKRRRVPVHPCRHEVATDSGDGPAVLGHSRGRVMGTSGAEVRHPRRAPDHGLQGSYLLFYTLQAPGEFRVRTSRGQSAGNSPSGPRWRHFLHRGEKPFAMLVKLAHHPRPDSGAQVVELLLELALDDAALLFDNEHLFEPRRKPANAIRFQGPTHADPEQSDAKLRRPAPVDPKIFQRLLDIQVGLAAGDDAQPGIRAVDDETIQSVGPGERQDGRQLVALKPPFLLHGRIRPADVQAAVRQLHGRLDDPRNTRNLHGLRGIGVFLGQLERHPTATEPGQPVALEPQLEHILQIGGIEDRNPRVDETVFALLRQRR